MKRSRTVTAARTDEIKVTLAAAGEVSVTELRDFVAELERLDIAGSEKVHCDYDGLVVRRVQTLSADA